MICTANRNGASSSRYITARREEVHDQEQRGVHGVAHHEHPDRRARSRSARTPRRRRCRAAPSCPPGPTGSVPSARRRLQQLLLRPDRVLARGERQLVVARERERAGGARLDAEAAHDAAQVVDLVVLRVPLPRAGRVLGVVVLPLDPDRVGRARERAELAADALLEAVLVPVQPVAADVRALGDRRDLLRILLGVVGAERLLEDRAPCPWRSPTAASQDGPAGSRRCGRSRRHLLALARGCEQRGDQRQQRHDRQHDRAADQDRPRRARSWSGQHDDERR